MSCWPLLIVFGVNTKQLSLFGDQQLSVQDAEGQGKFLDSLCFERGGEGLGERITNEPFLAGRWMA